nr:hypothetical protein [Tanacetum cinerariifolium]
MTNGESVKDMTTKFDKLVKFEGQDFRRWQKKMHFLLTTLKVVYVLSTPSPEWHEDETLETTRKRMKWENDDYICRGHILNGMDDSLFDIYQNIESAKALWEFLPVMDQYHEMLRTLGQYTQHNLIWMKPSRLQLSLINCPLPRKISNTEMEPKNSKNNKNNKNKRKFNGGGDKSANKKSTLVCWKCNKPGHIKKDCRSLKSNDDAGSKGSNDPEKQQATYGVFCAEHLRSVSVERCGI